MPASDISGTIYEMQLAASLKLGDGIGAARRDECIARKGSAQVARRGQSRFTFNFNAPAPCTWREAMIAIGLCI